MIDSCGTVHIPVISCTCPGCCCRKESSNGKQVYVYDHKYWEAKREPGFDKMNLTELW